MEDEEVKHYAAVTVRFDRKLGWVVESPYYGTFEVAYVGQTYEDCISYIGKDMKHE